MKMNLSVVMQTIDKSSAAIKNTLIQVAQLSSQSLLQKREHSIKKINSFVWPKPAKQLIAKIEEKLLS